MNIEVSYLEFCMIKQALTLRSYYWIRNDKDELSKDYANLVKDINKQTLEARRKIGKVVK